MNRKRSGGLVNAMGAPPPISSPASANNIAQAGPDHALIARSTPRDRLDVAHGIAEAAIANAYEEPRACPSHRLAVADPAQGRRGESRPTSPAGLRPLGLRRSPRAPRSSGRC